MPTPIDRPGVYIEEVPTAPRAIAGVATSVTAFVGRTQRGPVNEPVLVRDFDEFARRFGGLWRDSTLSYAVSQFFLNGGSDALIVRVANGGAAARFSLAAGAATLRLRAADPGAWANNLRVAIDYETRPLSAEQADEVFNLTVLEVDAAIGEVRGSEVLRDLSVNESATRYLGTVLEQESKLVALDGPTPDSRPDAIDIGVAVAPQTDGRDGDRITSAEIEGDESEKTGIYALERADIFNLLVIPPFEPGGDVPRSTWDAAAEYCERRRAVLIVDPPTGWHDAADVTAAAIEAVITRSANAALYFPYIQAPDPLDEHRVADFEPGGAVAGVIARTDRERGVWEAAAGTDAALRGVTGLKTQLTDRENDALNPLGVNTLRTFPTVGPVVWGARTLQGADQIASEWKYLPVRRLALYIEESLSRGTQWAVFEPNDEPLWKELRLRVGAFLQDLFRQGAFQGTSPRDAYFVRCDASTTTQHDIERGMVNVLVGFAPLKPAEFVVLRLEQAAGQRPV